MEYLKAMSNILVGRGEEFTNTLIERLVIKVERAY
jgi:hypothetical protein